MIFRYKLSDIFLVITYVSIGLIFYGNSFGSNGLTSLGTYVLAISCIGYGIFMIVKNLRHANVQTILVLSLIISLWIASTANSQVSIISSLLFLMLPFYIVICSYPCDNENNTKRLYAASIVYFIIQVFAAMGKDSHTAQSRWGAYQSVNLTLNYPNPNQTAMMLMPLFFIHTTFLLESVSIKRKILDVAICATEFVFVCLTGSRTGITLSLVAIAILVSGAYKRIGKKYGYICLAIPALTVLIIVLLPQLSTTVRFMNDALDTGRGEHYLSVIQNMTPMSFLFGDSSKFSGRNMMNGYITIWAEYGFFTLFCVLSLIILKVRTAALELPNASDKDKYGYCLFGLLIVQTAMESAYLTSGTVYAALVFLVLLCSMKTRSISEENYN